MSTINLPSLLKKDFENLNRKQILRRTKYCETIYEENLIILSQYLNRIHNEKYSLRSWEIIIGFWLRQFIYFSYRNYENLKFLIKKNNIKKLIVTKKNFNCEVNSTFSFSEYCEDFDFNIIFNSKLAKYFFKKKINIIEKSFANKIKVKSKKFDLNFNIRSFLFSLFKSIFSIFRKKNCSFISHTYLPFFEEKKLEYLIGQLPTFYREPEINYSKYNFNLRNKISLKKKKKKKNIINFIDSNLKFFIPKAFIEDFKQIKLLSQSNLYPKKPRFIFTSCLFNTDEAFKVFAASKVDAKIPLIAGQHGNNYFTRIFNNYSIDLKTCDYFYSWGYKKKLKIKNFFNFRILNNNLKYNQKTKLIIILPHFKEIFFDHNSNLLMNIFDIKKFIQALRKLKKNIKDETIIRLPKHISNKFNYEYYPLFKNLKIEIDNGDKKIDKLLEKAKLCVFNYDSTGFLENTLNKIPSLILENRNYMNSININYAPRYKTLLENKIMFTDPEKLVTHLNDNWNKINKWWVSKNVDRSINLFNRNLNTNPNKDSLAILAKSLNMIKKKN